MVVFSEVVNRALNGPFAREKDFDQKIFMRKIAEMVSRYGIKCDNNHPVPSDNDLADRIFQAALDYTTPDEPQFGTEVAHAILEMDRKEANGISLKLLDKYEKDLVHPPTGKKYQECFIVKDNTSTVEYREFYPPTQKTTGLCPWMNA